MVNAVKSSHVSSNLNHKNCFSSMRSHQALQASALVGRQVLVKHDTLILKNEGDVMVAIEIPGEISHIIASIHSRSGESIKILKWKEASAGIFQFYWDGSGENNKRLSPGQYKIKVSAIHNGQKVFLNTMISANVDSVNLGEDGKDLKLNVSGIGSISLDLLKLI